MSCVEINTCLLDNHNYRYCSRIKKTARSERIIIAVTPEEKTDLEVIKALDGFTTISETIRHMIRQRKNEMYAVDKELFLKKKEEG